MGAYPDLPEQPRNSGYHARLWNRRSGGWASISTGRSDPPPIAPSNQVSAELEVCFVDFQGLDPVVESRRWNSKLSCRSGRSRDPASALGQRRLDNLPLTAPLKLTTNRRRRFNLSRRPRCFFGKPHFVKRKNFARAQNYGSLDYVL